MNENQNNDEVKINEEALPATEPQTEAPTEAPLTPVEEVTEPVTVAPEEVSSEPVADEPTPVPLDQEKEIEASGVEEGKKGNKKIFIIVILLLLIGAGAYVVLGTDILNKDKKEEQEEQKDDSKKENTAEKFNGIYEKDGIIIKVYAIRENTLYVDIEKENWGSELTLEVKDSIANGDIFEEVYTFKLSSSGLDVEAQSEVVKNGLYPKTKDYTAKEFFEEKIGKEEYLKSEYNGVFDNNGISIVMYQTEKDKVSISITKKDGSSFVSYGRELKIKEDKSLVEDVWSSTEEPKITVTVENEKIKVDIKDEDYKELSGEYTKKEPITMEYLINHYLQN